jgi:hypothetical protein
MTVLGFQADRRPSGSGRRFTMIVGCWVALLLTIAMPAMGGAQDFSLKNLQGKVFDGNDAVITGAIVYLRNSRNSDVKTYLSEKDGTYRFAGLSSDTDYSVWAAYQGKKSPSKTVSSFDTRKQVFLDLKIK